MPLTLDDPNLCWGPSLDDDLFVFAGVEQENAKGLRMLLQNIKVKMFLFSCMFS